jgi:hypothetical protein
VEEDVIYARMPRLTRFKLFGLGQGLGSVGSNGTIPFNIAPPAVTGTLIQGSTLTVSAGTWKSITGTPSFTYQWYRLVPQVGFNPISGATGTTYILQAADVGDYIVVVVTATNSNGSGNAISLQVGPIIASAPSGPTVRGTPTNGSVNGGTSINLPTSVSGDELCVVVTSPTSSAPSTPSGWTLSVVQDGSFSGMGVYTKTATGSDTFVSSGSFIGAYNSYAIQNIASGVDGTPAKTTGTNATITAPSLTPTGSNDLLISCFAAFGGGSTPTIGTPSGGTPTAQQTADLVYALVTSSESLTSTNPTTARTAPVTNQVEWIGIAIAFK